MSARIFSPVFPVKFGRLLPFHFREVAATWLLEVYFCALPVTYRTSDTLKVIEVFPDVSHGSVRVGCTHNAWLRKEHNSKL